MNKYEAMVVIKPDLSDEDKKALFKQIDDAILPQQFVVDYVRVYQRDPSTRPVR